MLKTKQEFIAEAFQHGHFRGTLAEAAAALWECYCKADTGNRKTLISQLMAETVRYSQESRGWKISSNNLAVDLCESVHRANETVRKAVDDRF